MSSSPKSKTAAANLTEQLTYLKLPFILQQYEVLARYSTCPQ